MSTYEDQVRGYLTYCRRAAAELRLRGSALDPRYHPTADGCVKQVPHRGDPREARKIREKFGRLYGNGKTSSEGTAA